MITDEKLGLKIAENEDEEFWENIRQRAEEVANTTIPEQIKKLQDEQKLNLAIIKLAEQKRDEAKEKSS